VLHPHMDGNHWRKAAWQDPLTVVLAIAGIGAGLAIAVPGFRAQMYGAAALPQWPPTC
jgi:hypothetical protein